MTYSRLKMTTDVFLAPAEFEQVYRAVFAAAEVAPFYRTTAMHLRRPALA